MDINEARRLLNGRKKVSQIKINFFGKQVIKIMLSIILFLGVLITVKVNKDSTAYLKKQFYENSFNFSYVNNLYNKYLGGILPFKDPFDNTLKPVFKPSLEYLEKNKYLDGVLLKVTNNYLVPIMESGTIVFIGDKEQYGKVIIIQQVNGVDMWYANVTNLNVKLYDYVEKGKLLGETLKDELVLVFQKNGEFTDYNEYIK